MFIILTQMPRMPQIILVNTDDIIQCCFAKNKCSVLLKCF